MMLPERILAEVMYEKVNSTTHQEQYHYWNWLICRLQFSEIGQSLEHVGSQAANAVVGKVAESVKRQRNVTRLSHSATDRNILTLGTLVLF